jgi:ribonuclease Z
MLGLGGMMPLPNRWLSSMLLRSQKDVVLVDCGEGTQISWRYSNWPFRPVNAIVLTHFHADHVGGIAGVLFMIAHSGRTEPLTIFGPKGTYQAVQALTVVVPGLPYQVSIVEMDDGDSFTLPDGLQIDALAVDHRVPCLAYTFSRARAPRFNAERARQLMIPVTLWSRLQAGEAVEVPGGRVNPEQVLGPPRRGLKVGYVTDTRPTAAIPGFVRDADLLVCEGTYGDPELRERARSRGHMVFDEAATIAREAHAKRLILTHFSPSMMDPENYLRFAQDVFPNSEIGEQHETITLSFEDDPLS